MRQRDIFYRFPHWLQLVCLFLVFIGCVLVGGNIASMAAVLCFGADALGHAGSLLAVQGVSVVCGFLLPALWFNHMQQAGHPDYLHVRETLSLRWLGVAVLAYFLLCPFISFLQEWNMGWHLPEKWQTLEVYFRNKSLQMEELSKRMLLTHSWGVFAGSLCVVALGAGICEEFFFRGCLQNLFHSWFKNTHAAVWTTAAVFSLFHADFFGFMPRLFLGAFLGYLYLWSGSIWLSVIIHSLNNAILATAYFLNFNHHITFNPDSLEQSPPWYMVVPCLVACIGLCLWMVRTVKKKPSQS